MREAEFKEFLSTNNYFIDYNGVAYTLADKSNVVIFVTNTPDEMYSFIKGFNKAKELYENIMKEQTKIYHDNIERYENIIGGI